MEEPRPLPIGAEPLHSCPESSSIQAPTQRVGFSSKAVDDEAQIGRHYRHGVMEEVRIDKEEPRMALGSDAL